MFSVSDFLAANDLSEYADIGTPTTSSVRFVQFVEDRVFENFVIQWSGQINSEIGPSGRGRNKLQIYKLMNTRFAAENYCNLILPPRHRAAFSKCRCGVAPLRIETGRYEGLAEDLRLCTFCMF